MAGKRDTQTYDLKQGNKVVYKGTTNNLEKRAAEHRAEGKKFTNIKATSPKMTEQGAQKRESQQLETYRKGHGGRNPQYNKTKDG